MTNLMWRDYKSPPAGWRNPVHHGIGGAVAQRENVNGTGERHVNGDYFGSINTTGHVVIFGNLMPGASICNTGGVTIHGDLHGVINTTGTTYVFGDIKESARFSCSSKVQQYVQEMRDVEKTRYVPEKYTERELVFVPRKPDH